MAEKFWDPLDLDQWSGSGEKSGYTSKHRHKHTKPQRNKQLPKCSPFTTFTLKGLLFFCLFFSKKKIIKKGNFLIEVNLFSKNSHLKRALLNRKRAHFSSLSRDEIHQSFFFENKAFWKIPLFFKKLFFKKKKKKKGFLMLFFNKKKRLVDPNPG